jgi:hypothetical protein
MRLLGLLFLALAGCSSSPTSTPINTEASSRLKIGISTTTEVESNLGTPLTRNVLANGDEAWAYQYTKTGANPIAFVPYLGAVDLFYGSHSSEGQTLNLTFQKKILTSCKFTAMSATTGPMVSGMSTQTSTVEKKCG